MRNNMFFLLCRPVVPRNKMLNRHLQSLHSSHCVAKFTRSDARSRSRCKQLSASLSQRRVKRQWAESSLIIKNATRISQLRYLRFNPRLGFHFHSRDDANDTQTHNSRIFQILPWAQYSLPKQQRQRFVERRVAYLEKIADHSFCLLKEEFAHVYEELEERVATEERERSQGKPAFQRFP